MKLPSPALALALPLSSTTHACNPTAKTIVTTLNHTPTTSTLHMFQTLSNFAPDPNLCGVNTTIGVPPGYKARLTPVGHRVTGYIDAPVGSWTRFDTYVYFESGAGSPLRTWIKFKPPYRGAFNTTVTPPEPAVWSACEGDTLAMEYSLSGSGTTDGRDWTVGTVVEVERC